MDGDPTNRKNAIAKCALVARKNGFHMFAVQSGGLCAGSLSAIETFNKYGKSSDCNDDGEGGHFANSVYVIQG